MAESTIIETDARGELRIPAGILRVGPYARFRVEHEGPALRLVPETRQAVAQDSPAEERIRVFRDWVSGLPRRGAPPIPAEALRRENLYD